MLQAIKDKLSSLYHSGKSEFQKTPIQSLAALIVIVGILVQLATSFWLKVDSSNPVIKFLQEDTKINIPLITLSLGLLLWSFANLRNVPRHKDNAIHKEVTIGGVIWSATKYRDSTVVRLDEDARCEKHNLNLLQDRYSFYCPERTFRKCSLSITDSDYYKMQAHAESYLDKLFRDDK